MRRSWSIRSHLLALVLLAFLPLLMLLVQAAYVDLQRSLEVAERSSLALAEATAASIAQVVSDSELVLRGLAERPEIRQFDGERCDAYLAEIAPLLPRFANFFLVDGSAGVVCSALPAPAAGFEPVVDRAWFRRTMAGSDFTIGSPQVGRISGRWVSVMAVPVTDNDGRTVGVLGAALDLYRVQDLLGDADASETTLLTIDDLDGVVVARSMAPEEWVGRALPRSEIDPEFLLQPSGQTRSPGAEGVDRVWGFAAIPGTDWRAWAGAPSAEVYGPVREAALRKALLVLVALAMLAGLSLLLHRRIRLSLDGLVAAATRVGSGSTDPLPEDGPNEVRRVARHFNQALDQLRRTEEERIRTLERYRGTLEHAVFGIVVTDAHDRILEANPATARMLGLRAPGELRGRGLGELFVDPGRAEAGLDAALTAAHADGVNGRNACGTPRGVLVEWQGPEGVPITVRLLGTINRSQAGAETREWMIEDVTDQLRLEARLREGQKLEAVGRLAGGVAHDFNNLLTVVTTSAHMLRQDHGADTRVDEIGKEILDAAAMGASLTRQLLTFSRKQVVQPRPLDLSGLVSGMAGLLQRLLGDASELVTPLEEGPGLIEADPGQVEQVVLNLVVNARDASEPGQPVELSTRSTRLERSTSVSTGTLPPGDYVLLTVADRGTGIPDEIRERIFEPFFSTKEDGRGTGLGLATVYGITMQAGGGVLVESRRGRGSRFTVYFPRLPG
jgi:PAS domain S-box-containing protein